MSKRFIAGFAATVIAALALGVLIGSFFGTPRSLSEKPSASFAAFPLELRTAGMHGHKQKELPPDAAVPAIRIELILDPMKPRNYSLHVDTENFIFAPESVSMKPVVGEGHAHLYIDDVLIQRIYGPWHHIPTLKPGRHIIYVTLNYNDHDEYANKGNTIGAQEIIEVK